MWVTPAHMGMKGFCRRCGGEVYITPENATPAPVREDMSSERMETYIRTLLEQAAELIGRGKHDKAADILTAALGLDDSRAEVWYELGCCRFKDGQYAAACQALARAGVLGHPDTERLLVRAENYREWELSPIVLLNVPAYRQTRSRFEARQYRARLLNTPPQIFLDAGDPVAASESHYLRNSAGARADTGAPAIIGVDSDMDRASRLLAVRKLEAAIPLLKSAVLGYRNVGSVCAWDLADALWNLGYASCRLGRIAEGSGYLTEAAAMLVRQGRTKAWVRCFITLLTHRKDPPLLDSAADFGLLVRTCRHLGLRRELLWVYVLLVAALIETGRLRQAQRLWTFAGSLARKAGGTAATEYLRLRVKLSPGSTVRAVVYRLTEGPVREPAEIKLSLMGWDLHGKSPAQHLEALRAVQLAETIGLDGKELTSLAARLCCELAIAAYQGDDSRAGRAWWESALERAPDMLEDLCAMARNSMGRARRQGVMRLLDDHLRRQPSPVGRAALVGLLVLHSLDCLRLNQDEKAIRGMKTAVRLGLDQRELSRRLSAIGLSEGPWTHMGDEAGTAWTAAVMAAVEQNLSPEMPEPQIIETWLGSGI